MLIPTNKSRWNDDFKSHHFAPRMGQTDIKCLLVWCTKEKAEEEKGEGEVGEGKGGEGGGGGVRRRRILFYSFNVSVSLKLF